MSKIYMITAPRKNTAKEWVLIQRWIRQHDVHKWVIGAEKGANGYEHWQIRLRCGLSWEEMKSEWHGCHIEEASDNWTYEAKNKFHWKSTDTREVREQRFGILQWHQQTIIRYTLKGGDRTITVWLDEVGNSGKSWLAGYLHETKQGFYVPPTMDTAQRIIQWVASGYDGEPIIVIDIPRTAKWTKELYIAIESIKDGLVYDARYNTKIRNIRGVKILVLTNTAPKLDNLSADRWDIWSFRREELA